MLHDIALSVPFIIPRQTCLRFRAAVDSPDMLLMPLLLLAAAEANVIQDTLDKPPQPPWSWVREDAQSWQIAGGKLQIKAQRGTLWKADRNDAKNLLVRRWPAEAGDNALISVTVKFAPEQGGEQAGVMLYFGDDDYVKLVRESLEGKRWIVMGREEKGDGKQIAKLPVESDEVTLYLLRQGDKIEGVISIEGKVERPVVGDCTIPAAPAADAPLKIGLFAHGGPAVAEARWATFSDFKITPTGKK
jgi:regulation of enolase protein 1 (concanavalin A-like superfamily)